MTIRARWIAMGLIGIYIVAWGILVGALIYTRPETFNPISYVGLVQVEEQSVPEDNAIVHISITHCNAMDEDIGVQGSFAVRNDHTGQLVPQQYNVVSPDGEITYTGQNSNQGSWTPGCTPITAALLLRGLSGGTWHIEGTAVARSIRNQTQVLPYRSESFEVVP